MSALGAFRAAGLGFGLGVVTGMPLGVINVAIVEAATAGRRRFASGLGIGGGTADALHAMLAFTGVGRVVTADPALVRGLAIVAAIAIVAYAVVAWRGRTRVADPGTGTRAGTATGDEVRVTGDEVPVTRGLMTGLLLTLLNPGALAAWVAVAASVWPDASPIEAAVVAGSAGAGSALWFTTLARWIGRVRRDHPLPKVIARVALILLIATVVAGVVVRAL